MKKFTDFVIEKRYIILTFFIMLSIVSAILAPKVNINYDIAEYLPASSETRIGMNIMEEKFKEIKLSSLNLMFEDLNEDEKEEIYNKLIKIKGIDSVDYDSGEYYNKDNYTLYIINVADKEDSKTASYVYNKINNEFKDYEMYTSGSIASRNKPVLPLWIVVLAVGCAFIILMIMSESYVEPILFLTSILMAVLLNKGSNIIFDSVSNITDSISAILQMALSMDYSIMLMDRYRSERKQEKDKVKAMKNALFHAFTTISSSSVTTIVGLLALVFMSFTIGRDLGFVLAKGVLLSLLCIFFVLPSLILMCDKLIEKTKKHSLNIKLNRLGKLSYKCRYVATFLFIIAFVGSYLLKGNLTILYTDSQSDKIAEVFEENNQMAIIYQNSDEERITSYLKKLESYDKIDEVLAYGNTINEELYYNELNSQLKDLDSDIEIEEYLIKILYYKYYNQNEDNKMTFNEFMNFINNEVYNNPKTNEKIDNKLRQDISRLENFTNYDLINKKRDVVEIANILEGFNEEQIKDILVYYNSKNNDLKLSLNDFIRFMNNDVLTNKKYSANIDSNSIKNINTLAKFTNKDIITKKLTSTEMANLFEIPENTMNDLYMYYISTNEIDANMTIYEFSSFVLTDVLLNEQYANLFDEDVVNNIKLLSMFSNKDIINKKMNYAELSILFNVDENLVKQLLFLIYGVADPASIQITPNEFTNAILINRENELIKNSIETEKISQLEFIFNIMSSSLNNKEYTYQELSTIIGIDSNKLKNIYTLYASMNTSITLTPQEFTYFILTNQDDKLLANNIDMNTVGQLNLIHNVMSSVINNQKYNSNELSNLLGINKKDLDLIYGLYVSNYIKSNQTISLKEFVWFLVDDVTKNNDYSSNFTIDSVSKLNTINEIMNSSLNNTKYTKEEMTSILLRLSSDVDYKKVDLLYMYYGSIYSYNNNWMLTVEKLVNYLNEDILPDDRFNDFLEDDMKSNIKDSKKTVSDAKELLIGDGYSRIIVNTKLPLEDRETFNIIQKINDDLEGKLDEVYVIGDSLVAYEMSQTFQSELDFITILTMIFIFVVVAFTFKSFIIPLILVLIIQCAVFVIMGILSFSGQNVYFIALLIVQSILMGATIDYAILYTSYYIDNRKIMDKKEAIIHSYNDSIETILTSASILVVVTFIVGIFTSGITSMICKTLSQGVLCSALLILLLLPAVLSTCDKLIIKKKS